MSYVPQGLKPGEIPGNFADGLKAVPFKTRLCGNSVRQESKGRISGVEFSDDKQAGEWREESRWSRKAIGESCAGDGRGEAAGAGDRAGGGG
jgi:hypothetical protein